MKSLIGHFSGYVSGDSPQAGRYVEITKSISLVIFLLIIPLTGFAASFQGQVVKVSDGDTIQVMHNGKAEKIRLAEIDCPEKDQPYGKAAKRYVLSILAGKTVTINVHTVDRYGRTVGDVILQDNSIFNRIIVSEGYAWHYKKYSKDQSLGALETDARLAKRGLWQDRNPIAPWDWRRGKRGKATEKPTAVAGVYHGNVKSGVFHQSGCRYYACKNCTESFGSRSAALNAGYRACGKCKP